MNSHQNPLLHKSFKGINIDLSVERFTPEIIGLMERLMPNLDKIARKKNVVLEFSSRPTAHGKVLVCCARPTADANILSKIFDFITGNFTYDHVGVAVDISKRHNTQLDAMLDTVQLAQKAIKDFEANKNKPVQIKTKFALQ